MRGHLVKRARGSWSIVLDLPRENGKRKQQWIAVKGNRKQAEAKLTELLGQADSGYTLRPERITVQELVGLWLQDHAAHVRVRTLQGYESKMRSYVNGPLGMLKLRDLQPSHVQALYRNLLVKGLSAHTVLHVHRILQEALEYGVKLSYIARNPCKAVTPPRPERKEMRAMATWEANKVLDAAKATPYYALFHTALYTGLRRSELLGLRVRDVDLTLGTVHVAQTMHCLKGGKVVFTEPKSAKGRRTVALTPSNAVVLRDHLARLQVGREAIEIPLTDDVLVFSWPDGRPMLPDAVTHAWICLVDRIGLKGVRLHDARHTHASIMLAQGVHPKIVQERLGHSTIAITLDTYSHVAPGLQAAAALAFDKMLKPDASVEDVPATAGKQSVSNFYDN